MHAMQLLHWTGRPALALSAEGRILALNAPCAALVGSEAPNLTGRVCSDVAHERDARADADASLTCALLKQVATGEVVDLVHCALGVIAGESPAAVTGITIPPDERDDGVAAVVLLGPPARASSPDAEPDTAGAVHLRLLGPMQVVRDGVAHPVRRRRARELLALLALAGPRGISREEICETLWPAAPRGAGRGHLRVILHGIRHDLGDDLVEDLGRTCGTDSRLRLPLAVWTDAGHVEQVADARRDPAVLPDRGARCRRLGEVARALDHYRSDLDEAGEFGAWVAPHRERLRGRLLALLTEAIPLAASVGEFDAAVRFCRRAIEADPFEEGFRLSLIALYGHLGRSVEAQSEYDQYARVLADELSITPSERLRRAARRPA